ncbi:MAG: transporter [Moraxellaceae bacterium]|nr:transporter [Moraxellaceae bacterium]
MPTPISHYGADLTGLIWAYVFSADGDSRALRPADTEEWLAAPDNAAGEFIWLHCNLAHAGTENWLRRHLTLSDQFYETLHEGTRSTRIDHADGALIAVLNDVLFDFSFDASDIATLWLSVDARVVVTARTHPLRSVDMLREAVKKGERLRSPVELLMHLLRDEADVLVQIVRDIATRVDSIEDRLLGSHIGNGRSQLGNFRRLLVRLQRLLAPEPSALFRLLNRPPAWVQERDVLELRQSTEEFSTALSDMTALQERIKLLQEEIAATINEQNNRSLFVLTTVSVLALPINMIAGLFGMNVGGIPLAEDSAGFWIVVAIVATFTVMAGKLLFRGRHEP